MKVKGECGGLTSTAADSNLEKTGSSSTTTEAPTSEATTTEATTTEATTTEATSTATSTATTTPSCTPEWSCSDWQPLPETIACGQTFTQTRTCTDANNCGIEQGKPAEEQQATGTDSSTCGTTPCDPDGTLHLVGQCQNTCVEGRCQNCTPTCSCAEGWADCKNDLIDGCEFQLETSTSTCP